MSESDFINFARNLWWVTFKLLQALHIVFNHLSHEEMSNNFEAVFLSDIGLDIMLHLVIQNCDECKQAPVKMIGKH